MNRDFFRLLVIIPLVHLLLTGDAHAFSKNETDPATLGDYKCDKKTYAGRDLDLSGAVMTFEDEFLRPSVTPPEGKGPWYAPMHGGFGGAKFLRPDERDSPFSYAAGHLIIRMAKTRHYWTSGIIQSINAKASGFSQRYGYFEMRALLPAGMGTWPAFWLKSINENTDKTQTRTEIDIIEAYGGQDITGHHAAIHLWPAKYVKEGSLKKHWSAGCYQRIKTGLLDGQFHTYGAEVTPDWVIFYFDRKEIGRFPALPETRVPLFMLVDLAYNKDKEERTDETPVKMMVDYVRAWQRSDWRRQ